jgi:hypothetical protein
VAFFLLLACSSDACRSLCADVAGRLEGCLDEWGATWEDFDVSTRNAYGDRCRAEWDAERTELEPRQLGAATEDCAAAQLDLGDVSCDELRALYFEP